MYELIVGDLDDTLLDPKGELSPRTLAALHEAIEAGARVTFATGRMVEAASFFAGQLGINAPLIAYNGALVYDLFAERTVSRLEIPMATARAICKLAEETGLYMQAYPGDRYFCAERCEHTARYSASIHVRAWETPGHQPLSEWISSGQLKLLGIGAAEAMPEILTRFRTAFPEGVDFYMSKPTYMETVSATANKANALKALAESLGIKRENVLAFGDGQNDIAMLEYAGCGCAVANASAEVRARADRVVAANSEDGVAREIERLLAAGQIGKGAGA